MKYVATTLAAIFLASTVAHGQEAPGPNFDHLKLQGPTIGTWRYEGPLLEDMPGLANKGTKYATQIAWRWILNKNAVEVNWRSQFAGGKTISGKGLLGWNAAEDRIVFGDMDSTGGMTIGTVVFEDGGKTSNLTAEGIDGEGRKTTFKGVVKKTGKDTITWQALVRTGGPVDGESPVYTLKRVKRTRRAKSAK